MDKTSLLAHNQKVESSNLVQAVPPSARVIKQGCNLRTHAFKIMRRLKRTWIIKQKSRGPKHTDTADTYNLNEGGVKLAAHSTLRTAGVPQCVVSLWEPNKGKRANTQPQ